MKRADSLAPLALAGRLLGDDDATLREDIARSVEFLKELEFARRFVPYIIAKGAMTTSDEIGEGVESVCETIARRSVRHNLGELCAAKDAAADLPPQDSAKSLDDLFWDSWFSGQRAGYLLGVAVGQALGPDAFKGGAR